MSKKEDTELIREIARSSEYQFLKVFIAILEEHFPKKVIEKFYPRKMVAKVFFGISLKIRERASTLSSDSEKMDFVRQMHSQLPAYVAFLRSKQPE